MQPATRNATTKTRKHENTKKTTSFSRLRVFVANVGFCVSPDEMQPAIRNATTKTRRQEDEDLCSESPAHSRMNLKLPATRPRRDQADRRRGQVRRATEPASPRSTSELLESVRPPCRPIGELQRAGPSRWLEKNCLVKCNHENTKTRGRRLPFRVFVSSWPAWITALRGHRGFLLIAGAIWPVATPVRGHRARGRAECGRRLRSGAPRTRTDA